MANENPPQTTNIKQPPKEPKNKSKSEKRVATTTRRQHRLVNPESETWPVSIVWTPIPILTWFLPTIGHTGITDSRGVIYDFSDDYHVSVDNFSFGDPTKVYQFSTSAIPHGEQSWDQSIKETAEYFNRTRHSLCFNNCHQYIAEVLNRANYGNRKDWSQTAVWWMITYRSEYVGFGGFLRQWLPFTIILITSLTIFVLVFFTQ